MKLQNTLVSLFFTMMGVGIQTVTACSDILVTPGASEDGSAMIAYNADDVSLFGYLYHYPPTQGKAGEMIQVYEWDSGVSTKKIPPCRRAFRVIQTLP